MAVTLMLGLFVSLAYAAGLFDRDDQHINGNWTFWNGVTFKNGVTLTDATITATGKITETHIANHVRPIYLPLSAAYIDGTSPIGADGTTAPGIAETDSIPAIVYASSAETTKIQWSFQLPDDYVSGLGFDLLVSSGGASGTQQSIDWQIWVNRTSLTFDAAALAGAAVAGTIGTLNASCEVFTFTANATMEAAITGGDIITVDFFNAGSSSSTTEIKNVQGYYTATM